MFSTLRNAWKVPELRKKIIFTILMIAIYRMGNFIPVPGIDTHQLTAATNSNTLFSFYNMISGGAFGRASIFALGVVPFINASIIIQLLTIAIPRLEQLSKEGEEGRKKIMNFTRYSSIAFGVIQAFGQYAIMTQFNAVADRSPLNIFLIILTMTTASTFLMWLGDQITVNGIGNGVSMIIFFNIISRFPSTIYQLVSINKAGKVNVVEMAAFIAVVVVLLVVTIIVSLSERRIPVHYAGKAVGNKTFKGQQTHIPVNVNSSAVIGIIFAMSVMYFPKTIGALFPNSGFNKVVSSSSLFREDSWIYVLVYFILIIFFTWFYTQVTFKPEEMAENMHKSSGFIPGIRPGENTSHHIEKILDKVSVLGGMFAAIIAITPIIVANSTQFKGISFGGTGLLIIVGVATEFVRQIEAQLVMRHYQGFLK